MCVHSSQLKVCLCVQLDNPDEQAAQIRRELDGRLQMADQIARVCALDSHVTCHCYIDGCFTAIERHSIQAHVVEL